LRKLRVNYNLKSLRQNSSEGDNETGATIIFKTQFNFIYLTLNKDVDVRIPTSEIDGRSSV
jgi:hypothetical protein